MTQSKSSTSKEETRAPDLNTDGAAKLVNAMGNGAENVASDLKSFAGGVAQEVKKTAEKKLVERKGRVAESLGGVADALRHTTTNDDAPVAEELRPMIEKAADHVDRVSRYVDKSTMGDMLEDVQSFARREPALFLGGAFFLGLIGGRFLKASKAVGSDDDDAEAVVHQQQRTRTGRRGAHGRRRQ
ncbi:hypothetical protein BH09MYX1_BH09MYX1_00370 [soil metagenome]